MLFLDNLLTLQKAQPVLQAQRSKKYIHKLHVILSQAESYQNRVTMLHTQFFLQIVNNAILT